MNEPEPIPIKRLLEEKRLRLLELAVVAGASGLESRSISNPRIQKPGLALAGYLPYVKPGRVQILGASEHAYLETLDKDERDSRITEIVNLDVACIISTKGFSLSTDVMRHFDELEVPLLVTRAQTSDVIEVVSAFLEDALAPRRQVHGVLADVFSLGTLIIGDAGIGKSECALELVARGHRLVADDIVVIQRTHNHGLRGKPHELLENYLELRGVGIIDIRKHFGMTATSPSIQLSLVIELIKLSKEALEQEQEWRSQLMAEPYSWTSTKEILGVEIPKYTMAVAPGRAVALMVETAVRKCLLAQRGIQDERTFLEGINQIAGGSRKRGRIIDDE